MLRRKTSAIPTRKPSKLFLLSPSSPPSANTADSGCIISFTELQCRGREIEKLLVARGCLPTAEFEALPSELGIRPSFIWGQPARLVSEKLSQQAIMNSNIRLGIWALERKAGHLYTSFEPRPLNLFAPDSRYEKSLQMLCPCLSIFSQ